jgi:hypothetical protein
MRRLLTLATFALTLAACSAASAADLCVAPATGCTQQNSFPATGAGLQDALNAAAGSAGPDRVLVGAGTYTANAKGFSYTAADPVEVAGAGRGATVLTAPAGTATVLAFTPASPGSSLHDLTARLGADAPNNGEALQLAAPARDLTIDEAPSQASFRRGVRLESGGSLADSAIELPQQAPTVAMQVVATDGAVRRTSIRAATGITANAGAKLLAKRLAVTTRDAALDVTGASVTIRNSLVRMLTSTMYAAIYAETQPLHDAHLVVDGVTVIGAGGQSQGISAANLLNEAQTTDVVVRNSVIRGFGNSLLRDEHAPGHVTLDIQWSDFDPATVDDSGAGAIAMADDTFVADPGFVGADDFHLKPSSSLVDAGDPAAPAADETDLDGADRALDGDGDGIGRRDVGAYEAGDGPPVVVDPPGGDVPAPAGETPAPAGDTTPAGDTAPTGEPVPPVTPVGVPGADRLAPRLSGLRAGRRGHARRVRVRFTLDESARVVVRVGRRRVVLAGRSGVNRLALKARGRKVVVVATDAAGNAAKASRKIRRR